MLSCACLFTRSVGGSGSMYYTHEHEVVTQPLNSYCIIIILMVVVTVTYLIHVKYYKDFW